jgi:hypothetical protein
MKSFDQIASESGSDKYSHHAYHRFYPNHLNRIRNNIGNMLEIGINTGSSLKLWKEYFPGAFIYGADIGVEEKGDRYEVHKIDQSSIDDLRRLKDIIKTAFFIIDDGSHIPSHQVISFDYLFRELLADDGVYIVEDIECSYWRKGELYGYPTRYGYAHQSSFVEIAKHLVDVVNIEFVNPDYRKYLLDRIADIGLSFETISLIASIEFCHNCIIFRRKSPWELGYSERSYRSECNL